MRPHSRVLLAVPLAATITLGMVAAPATADPIFYWQVEKVRTQVGVAQGAEELWDRVRPVSTEIDPPSQEQQVSSTWTVSNSETRTAVLDWALGLDGSSGVGAEVGVSDNVKVEQNQGVDGRASLSGSRSTTITRSSSTSMTSTFRFSVKGPRLTMKRGHEIWGHKVGNRHILRARHCTAIPGGGTGNDRCGAWKQTVLFQPTGIGLRYQGLGWGDLHFSAAKCCLGDPQPKWITNSDRRLVGQQICPTVTGLSLDVRTSRYRFGCAYAGDPATGIFTLTAVKDNVYPYDVDSFVAELRGSVVGKVRVTRERLPAGGSVRPLTMTSIGNLTAREWANGQRGTFKITNWEGS